MGVILCPVTQAPAKMGDHILLDLEEWALVLSKMLRFHFNISEDIKKIVQTIRVEMKPELIPLAEEKSNFGKVVKKPSGRCGLSSMKSTSCRPSLPSRSARWTWTTSTSTSSRT